MSYFNFAKTLKTFACVLFLALLFTPSLVANSQNAGVAEEPPVPTVKPPALPAMPSNNGELTEEGIKKDTSSINIEDRKNDSIIQKPMDGTNLNQPGNNPKPGEVTIDDVNPGNVVPRTGGAQFFGTLFIISIISLGGYVYHKKVRDKSQFKMVEKRIK
jgi:hypothetical protein